MVSSFNTAAVMFVIALIYVFVVRARAKVSWNEAWVRTGLICGPARWWLIALAVLVPWLGYIWLSFQLMPVTTNDTHSPYLVMLGQGLKPEVLATALAYGLVSAGFGEELIFRGLIAGALGRRMTLAKANVVQALIFLAPHLLILLINLKAALLLPIGVMGLGLITGWLRLRSGSIGPAVLIHGLGNTFVGVLAALN